jgi:KaiC/GvpD/RAD55 family RecA-like ATPase
MSLAKIQEAPQRSLILLVGPPGAGQSTFCQQTILDRVAAGRSVPFVTTGRAVPAIIRMLSEKGLGTSAPEGPSFVDALATTVGSANPERSEAPGANGEDLNSINISIAKLQHGFGTRNIFLDFDSLTSPYLFTKEETFRGAILPLHRRLPERPVLSRQEQARQGNQVYRHWRSLLRMGDQVECSGRRR